MKNGENGYKNLITCLCKLNILKYINRAYPAQPIAIN